MNLKQIMISIAFVVSIALNIHLQRMVKLQQNTIVKLQQEVALQKAHALMWEQRFNTSKFLKTLSNKEFIKQVKEIKRQRLENRNDSLWIIDWNK